MENPSCHGFKPKINFQFNKISPPIIGIKSAKRNNVLSLLRYLSPAGREFYENFFSTLCTNEEIDETDDE